MDPADVPVPHCQHSGYSWQTRTQSAALHLAGGGEAPCALHPPQAKLPKHPEQALATPGNAERQLNTCLSV